MTNSVKRVLIAGGGFAGVRAALNLSRQANLDVTLISDRASFEYHAALYRTTTGRSVLEVSVPLTQIFRRHPVTVIENRIKSIDQAKKLLTTEDGWDYSYDIAILALGSAVEYYGIKGLPEFAYSLKSVDDASRLRNHLHHALISGSGDLNYVVVGGGPSGVELASELSTYLNRIRRKHKIDRPFNLTLVEAAPRVLPTLPESISRKAAKRLKQLGIKVYTDTAVKAETADQLQLPEGNVKTHTVIWTAGISGNQFFKDNAATFKLAKGNRVEVDDKPLAAADIFVLGDSASTEQSGWAQTALYDANFVSRIIAGKPAKYRPPVPIGAIPMGEKWCLVSGRRQHTGYSGWIVRRWLDWKLFSSILPFWSAVSTWLYGTKRQETCPICR